MKFIHLTDTHIVGGARPLYGADPALRLRRAVDSINAEHGDAAFVIVTGDMTHWGDASAYAAFATEVDRLTMPVHLMVGNHDERPGFATCFPTAPRDENGFVQFTFDTDQGRAICLDTSRGGSHAGGMCAARLAWLDAQLAMTDTPVLLFMHHPPFPVGIGGMDAIMMQDHAAFHAVIAAHKPRIRHLFFGHVHRAIFGNWRGISFSCMRGLNHQVALDLTTDMTTPVTGDLANPAYGIVLVDRDAVVVHMHDFSDRSPRFALHAPGGKDPADWALNMRHTGFADPHLDPDPTSAAS